MTEAVETQALPTRDAIHTLLAFIACAYHAGCALALAIFLTR